jgi:hypothetical protein
MKFTPGFLCLSICVRPFESIHGDEAHRHAISLYIVTPSSEPEGLRRESFVGHTRYFISIPETQRRGKS